MAEVAHVLETGRGRQISRRLENSNFEELRISLGKSRLTIGAHVNERDVLHSTGSFTDSAMGIVEFMKRTFHRRGRGAGNPKTLREAITLLNALGYDLDADVESIKVNTLSTVTKRAVVTLKLRGVDRGNRSPELRRIGRSAAEGKRPSR